jgi:hypothetical protein
MTRPTRFVPEDYLWNGSKITLWAVILGALSGSLSLVVISFLHVSVPSIDIIFGVVAAALFVLPHVEHFRWVVRFGVLLSSAYSIVLFLISLYLRLFPSTYVALSVASFMVCLAVVTTLIVSLVWACDRRIRGRPYLWSSEVCGFCAYSIVGNMSGICPECGREVEARKAPVTPQRVRWAHRSVGIVWLGRCLVIAAFPFLVLLMAGLLEWLSRLVIGSEPVAGVSRLLDLSEATAMALLIGASVALAYAAARVMYRLIAYKRMFVSTSECEHCRYDLTGTPKQCPECGLEVAS